MSKTNKVVISIAIILSLFVYFTWPVYQAMAYKGKAAFLPFYQFTDLPDESNVTQRLVDNQYKQAGNVALALIDKHRAGINAPGISAAVAIDGDLIWAGAAGWADIDTATPVTTNTQFRVGSTSKAITATGLARLVDAGKLDLDNSIANYLVDLPNQQWQDITPRQLASHTAGLPHYFENNDYLGFYRTISLSTRYEKVNDAVSVFDGSDLLFQPGSQFSYSSLGTVLLSAVMSDAAEKPYLTYMQEQVFSPLNMQSTKAEFQADDSDQLTTFYWNDEGRSSKVRPWRDVDLSHRLAGGGFISTSSDLVKLGMGVLDDNYISSATRDTFWTPQTLPNGEETPSGYSIGWRVISHKVSDEIGEITFANHGGVSRGAQSWLMVIPKYHMAIAVNINANTDVFWDFAKVSMQLAEVFITEKSKQFAENE